MGEKFIRLVFFGNYFVGLLAIALSAETAVQLRIPFDQLIYYLLLFSGTVVYYTYAYTGALQSGASGNLRAEWYRQHRRFVSYSQILLAALGISLAAVMMMQYGWNLLHLPLAYWLVIAVILLASILYYGLLPRSFFKLNLRNTGWFKAFVIGFVWAGCVSLVPVIVLRLEAVPFSADPVLLVWLFIKNWMFCTVNAIMFDLKDYDDDSNKQLKTFVVRFGLYRTIFYVLIPLCVVGIFFMLVFAWYRHLGLVPILINLIPFLLLLIVSYSMQRQKSIFYYLIVIDGLVMIKAICGILAMQFVSP